jgi:serine/threonine protein kinase
MNTNLGSVRNEGEGLRRDGSRRSSERDLILSALNQVDQASSWTSRPTSGLGGASGTVSPDAPTAAESSFPSTPRLDELPTKDAFPGYEIQREIHRGGQGVVYLANQINAKRRVAIKVMHGGATLGSKGRVRFEREVQLLGQINHSNVVKLHDSGVTADGSFFYVMDYISGKALDEILREQRREARGAVTSTGRSRSRSRAEGIEDIETTLRFFAKVCDGVNAAHLKGVIHRDIKPANVRVDQSGEPVLVDFGLAKVTAGVESDMDPSNPMTMTGQFIGSLPWASPEQAVGSGDAIDLRSDVYSLGVMLYQLLTGGKFPYTVIGNMRDVLDNIQRAEPTRPSTVRRQINDEIETIVLKALAKDRERRYQSAGELARDVRRYLKGEPIEAKRDAGWYVIRKSLNRHKFAVAFAATVGILITGSAVGMTGLWRQAEGARAVAVVERDRAEENLDAVRDLAHAFLYDFNDSIANLRGATKARETVLAKALEYLAMLADQPGRDAGSLDALADAHERVGDLYGALNTANTGTTAQAIDHYAAALDIRNQLVVMTPGDLHHLSKLAKTWERVGNARIKQQDLPGAMDAYQTGLAAAMSAGDTPVRLSILTHVADTHRRVAVELVRDAGAFDQRMDLAAQMYAEADNGWSTMNNPEIPRRRAVLLSKSAQGLVYRGRIAEKFRKDPVAAEALLREGNAMIEQAILQFENLRAANPADYVTARDLWVVLHYLGQSQFDAATAYDALDNAEAALEARLAAMQTFTRLRALAESLAMDLSNLEAQRDLATTVNKQANTLRELGRLTEARAEFAGNVARWHALYISDPVERHLRDLGVGQFKVAEMDELLAERAATEAERGAILRLAQAGYQTTLETFREYGRRGGPADGVIGSVQSALDRVTLALQDG